MCHVINFWLISSCHWLKWTWNTLVLMTLVVLEIEQKRPVNNSSQNGSRDPQFCMKIDLALLIPTIYITHIVQNGT